MSIDGGGDEERPAERTPPEAPQKKAGKGRLLVGIGLGALLMLGVNVGLQQFGIPGVSGPPSGGAPVAGGAGGAARGAGAAKGFGSLLDRVTGGDGKICVRIWDEGDVGIGDAYVEKLKEREPTWDVSTSKTEASCKGDFFVTIWGAQTETHNYEYGGFWTRDTRTTYNGYVGVQAFNAPGLTVEPGLTIMSDSDEDDVLDDMTKALADYVRESGPGRQGRFKIAGKKDGQTCIALTNLDKDRLRGVAEGLQSSERDIWVLHYLTDQHNEQTCPPDFYITYGMSAMKSTNDGNVGYTTAFAFNEDAGFPRLVTGFHRNEVRSSNLAFEHALNLLGTARAAERSE